MDLEGESKGKEPLRVIWSPIEMLGKIGKPNELGFQELAAILSPLGLYGGNRKSKMPLLAN
jgi:hypothetical protein